MKPIIFRLPIVNRPLEYPAPLDLEAWGAPLQVGARQWVIR